LFAFLKFYVEDDVTKAGATQQLSVLLNKTSQKRHCVLRGRKDKSGNNRIEKAVYDL